MKHLNTLEAFTASLGVMVFGWASIPLVGYFSGVSISVEQGVKMSAYFFVLRFVWMLVLRVAFSKLGSKP